MISIIGGGPSGSYLAYLLGKEGKDVNVFEEHSQVGKPIQCTGLVTSFISELIDIKDEFVVNLINKVKVVAPNGEFVEFNLKKPNFVFDRGKFDEHIADMAMREGVKYYFGKKFIGCEGNKIKFENGDDFESDYIVGADGPLSSVAKFFGMYNNRKFMTGMQARVNGDFDPNKFVVYLGKGYFGWSVPESNKYSRVGVIASHENPRNYFEIVLGKEKGEIVEYQSGLIPIYQPSVMTRKDNVFLIGDAATQCKGSTHGGIIQGMVAAGALRDAILNGGDYEKLWRKKLGRDLYFHLKIRQKIDRMNDKNLNYMVKLVRKEKVKNILETYDRDFASKIVFKVLMREPRFLRLAI